MYSHRAFAAYLNSVVGTTRAVVAAASRPTALSVCYSRMSATTLYPGETAPALALDHKGSAFNSGPSLS